MAKAKKPTVVVDKLLKARWQDALARYQKAVSEETQGWDERYEALGEIVESEPPLYLAGGYKTARAFFAEQVPGVDERSIRSYIRVAKSFDPEDETKYGISKLEALLDYLQAVGGGPVPPAKINPARQKVRVRRGKLQRLEPFAEVTVADLKEATRASTKHPVASLPPEVKELRAALQKAKLGGISVRLRQQKFDLGGIRASDLRKVGKVLASAKLSFA